MGLGKLVRDFACGVTLASVLAFGGCAGDLEEVGKKSKQFTVKPCAIEASFYSDSDQETLLKDESKVAWEKDRKLVLQREKFVQFIQEKYPNIYPEYNYFGSGSGTNNVCNSVEDILDSSIYGDDSFFLIASDNDKKIVSIFGEFPDRYSTNKDTLETSLSPNPVKFDAKYKGRVGDTLILEVDPITMAERFVVSLDSGMVKDNLGEYPYTKKIISHDLPAVQSSYIGHNSSWIIYKSTKAWASSGSASLEEGIYAYDVNAEKSTLVSISGKDDTFLEVVGDELLFQQPDGKIWRGFSKNSKIEVAPEGSHFLASLRGRFFDHSLAFYDTEVGGRKGDSNSYIMYGKDDNILVKNMDMPGSSPVVVLSGVSNMPPEVFRLSEATYLVKDGSNSHRFSLGPSHIFDLESGALESGAPDGNVSVEYLGHFKKAWAFYKYNDEDTEMVFGVGNYHFRDFFLNQGDFVLPYFSTTPNGKITNKFHAFNHFDLSIGQGHEAKYALRHALDDTFEKLFKENDFEIIKTFLPQNSVWYTDNSTGTDYYLDLEEGNIWRIDGEYSTHANVTGAKKLSHSLGFLNNDDFNVVGVIDTTPPLFVLEREGAQWHKVLVAPK